MKKGLTLIELLIVVVVIGVLASIAIPNFIRVTGNAREASVKANMHTLQLVIEHYGVITEGIYPGGIDTKVSVLRPDIGPPEGDKSIAEGVRVPPFPPDAMLMPHLGFKNPFKNSDNAINNLFAGPPAVPPSGCVYYTGYKDDGSTTIEGERAVSYKISGYGAKGPLGLTLP